MESKVDFVINDKTNTSMYINYDIYNSQNVNWVSIENLFKNHDFIDILSVKLTGRKHNLIEKEILLKTLMITSMGVGDEPPSVFIPKTIASTTKDKRFALINGLIGGLAAFGTHHLGAVYDCMQMYIDLKNKNIKEYINKKLNNNEVIFGFGHPHYYKDPRPSLLLKEIRKYFNNTQYINNYDQLVKFLFKEKGIYANIDAIAALAYVCLGFKPEQGPYLSFIARSLNMVCHIFEEIEKKPFTFFINNLK